MHPLIHFSEAIQRTKSTQLKVSLRAIEDRTFVDIRICVRQNGEYLATNKGVTVPIMIFDELMETLKKIEDDPTTTKMKEEYNGIKKED